MSKWINVDDYIKYLADEWIPANLDAVNAQPSIDIVRCKECKHWRDCSPPSNATWCTRGANLRPQESGYVRRKADDFCSYGEREGE